MTALKTQTPSFLNGIDTQALFGVRDAVIDNPDSGKVSYCVKTDWQGQTKSVARTKDMMLAGKPMSRNFEINADEPHEFLGENTAPNPQELVFAGMNACIMATFVIGASVRGIKLDSVSVETKGDLDLRGFLGIDASVKPGFDTIHYTISVSGDGTQEQYEEIHDAVKRTSPNRFNLAMPVNLNGEVVVKHNS